MLSLPKPTAAQAAKTVEIEANKVVPFKLKLTRNLNSGRVRVGDYVQFELIEEVKYPNGGGLERDTIIAKGTPVYGKVLDRHRRFTFFKKGHFSIGKLWTTTADGQTVDLFIRRPDMPPELCVNQIPQKKREAQRKAAKSHAKHNQEFREVRLEEQKTKPEPCVNGRVYAGSFISNLPSALLAITTATTLTRVKDNATDAVVAVTLADKIATQSGLSNIINGADAEMEKDEIFDATIDLTRPLVIKVPLNSTSATSSVERVGRFTAPTPHGYIITDYFSDVVKYPSTPGQPGVYTGKVIERYTDKPVGAKMNMCESQTLPDGWEVFDRGVDPKICPREPGDPTKDPNYTVIMKMR